jgi:hypothetical protein
MVNRSNQEKNKYDRLSILIQQDGFSFYLHNDNAKTSLKHACVEVNDLHLKTNLKLFEKELDEIFNLHQIKNVKLAFANELFSLVPSEYYKEDTKADYLKFNVQLFSEDHIVAEYISDIDAYLLFIPYMNYHNVLLEFVEEFDFVHFNQTLIEDTYKKQSENQQKMKVFVRQKQLDIVSFDGYNFKMCNTFSFNSDIDIIYYILFSIEELDFNQEDMVLNIFHEQQEHNWVDVLKKYVKNIVFEEEDLTALAK